MTVGTAIGSLLLQDGAVPLHRPLDAARDPIVVFGGDGIVLEWNAAAEEMFGHDKAGSPRPEPLVP